VNLEINFCLVPYPKETEKIPSILSKNYKEKTRAKILLIWDGAADRREGEMKKFLAQKNLDFPPEQWSITCYLFAPYTKSGYDTQIWYYTKTYKRFKISITSERTGSNKCADSALR
jgi:hypothetical protein